MSNSVRMAALTAIPDFVEGPGWSPHDLLDVRGGLFPLSVETHFIATIGKLLPGTTTVTTLARYYSLHAYVACVASDADLPWEDAVQLLRRAEIVVAGATILALKNGDEFPHGYDTIRPRMDAAGFLDVAGLAQRPGGYSDQPSGFLPAYVGSESDLGLLTGNALAPGPRANRTVLGAAFEGLVSLARRDRVEFDDLRSAAHLSINAATDAGDGPWLARILCGVGVPDPTPNDEVRNATARLLGRALLLDPASSPLESFRRLVMYGAANTSDPVAAAIPVAAAWRGCLFRHLSVGAWRILWHWTVEQIKVVPDPQDLATAMGASLPRGTLGEFVAALPATTDAAGDPLPAEESLRQRRVAIPELALAILVLGARRYDELDGRAREAFADARPTVFSPPWVRNWVVERHGNTMTTVAADLTEALLDRAKRVAFRKMRVRADGSIGLPTRVHDRNGHLIAVGSETSRNVGVRLEQFARVLTSLGVLERIEGETKLAAFGADLLEVSSA
jgi:hypothetical protein